MAEIGVIRRQTTASNGLTNCAIGGKLHLPYGDARSGLFVMLEGGQTETSTGNNDQGGGTERWRSSGSGTMWKQVFFLDRFDEKRQRQFAVCSDWLILVLHRTEDCRGHWPSRHPDTTGLWSLWCCDRTPNREVESCIIIGWTSVIYAGRSDRGMGASFNGCDVGELRRVVKHELGQCKNTNWGQYIRVRRKR